MKKSAPVPAPGAAGPSGDQAPSGVQLGADSDDIDDNLVEEGDAEARVPGEFEYISDMGEDDE